LLNQQFNVLMQMRCFMTLYPGFRTLDIYSLMPSVMTWLQKKWRSAKLALRQKSRGDWLTPPSCGTSALL